MPLMLADLPVEVLSEITSLLPSKVVLGTLFELGNTLFCSKLLRGGVTDLILEPHLVTGGSLTRRTVWLLRALPLRSLHISALGRSGFGAVIRSLQPTLRHLTGSLSQAIELKDVTDLNPIAPLTDVCHAVWSVRSSFPQLQSLHWQDLSTLSPVSFAKFLLGLPPTLSSLQMPFLQPTLTNINFSRLLPPNLTALIDARPRLPDSSLPTSIMHLAIGFQPEPDAFYKTTGSWKVPSHPTEACLPPSLTWLDLSVSQLPEFMSMAFPSSLTRLRMGSNAIVGNEDYNISSDFKPPLLPDLLKLVPASVTHLEVEGWFASLSGLEVVLPRVKKAIFALSQIALNATESPRFYASLLACVPNAEDICLRLNYTSLSSTSRGLDVEHLSMLNLSRIHSLTANLRESCFIPTSTGQYPLESLTRLKTLVMDQEMSGFKDFTFAAIPPSLTSLGLSNSRLPISTLHLLPQSVTLLRAYLTLESKDLFGPLFPRSPSIVDSRPKALEKEWIQGETLGKLPYYEMARYSVAGKGNIGISFSPRPSGSVAFQLTSFPEIPPSLTSLSLPVTNFITPWETTITPAALPQLRVLDVFTSLPKQFDPCGFASLTSLSLGSPSSTINWNGSAPPNLIRLRSRGHRHALPRSFMATLPLSVTEIILAQDYDHLDTISHLVNLKTYQVTSQCTASLQYVLNALPPQSLTFVTLPRTSLKDYKEASAQLTKRFTALKTIHFAPYHVLSQRAFDYLYRTLPDHVHFDMQHFGFNSSPDYLASRIGIAEGSVLINYDNPAAWYQNALLKAYPRMSRDASVTIPWTRNAREIEDLSEEEGPESAATKSSPWSGFMRFISPEQQKLDFESSMGALPPDFASQLPQNLKSLITNYNDRFALTGASCLPRTLTLLEIPACKISIEELQHLPESITRFSFDVLSESASWGSLPCWPSGLKDLRCRFKSDLTALRALSVLPPTLTKLHSDDLKVSMELVQSLPKGLRYLNDGKFHPWSAPVDAYARSVGLTRLLGSITESLQNYDISAALDQTALQFAIYQDIKV